MEIDPRLTAIATSQPFPMLFATISGAHLYGFPSPDSDYDLRGAHILPLRDVLGLKVRDQTREISRVDDGLELDLVTHDVLKFFEILLKRNGYVLEQLLSPLVVVTTREHAELVSLVPGLVTRHHVWHYLGFAATQWRLFEKEQPRRVKPLLYVYRVLLTGLHLMKTGRVEANLLRLNEDAQLPYINDLVARKLAGPEQSQLPDTDWSFHEREYNRLRLDLEQAGKDTSLSDRSSCDGALNDLLIRVRLGRG
jgi:predicted nucleotidyltransferase